MSVGACVQIYPRSSIPDPTTQGGAPGGGLSRSAQFSPKVVVGGGAARTPRVSSFMRLKNPRTVAKNQEDPKSRTWGTKQLGSSPS